MKQVLTLSLLLGLTLAAAPAGASHNNGASTGTLNSKNWKICVYAPNGGGSAASAGVTLPPSGAASNRPNFTPKATSMCTP